jgi:hypothetical protein
MVKLNTKISLVFDSFISPWGPKKTTSTWIDTGNLNNGNYTPNYTLTTITKRSPSLAILLPGIRWQLDPRKAFQFGFTGLYYDGKFVPFPVPMVQWYVML